MKTTAVLAAAVVIFLSGAFVNADIKDGLAAYYNLDANAQDSSPNQNHGALKGTAAANNRDQDPNSACYFNGINHFIMIPPSSSLDIKGSITLCAWVKNDSDDDGQIIWRGDAQGGLDPYQLHFTSDRMEFRLDRGNGTDGRAQFRNVSKDKVDHEWHFWTAVFDEAASKSYLYKDGVLDNVIDVSAPLLYDTAQMWNTLGAVDTGNWQFFRGTIDEVRIYNRALTPEEITTLQHTISQG